MVSLEHWNSPYSKIDDDAYAVVLRLRLRDAMNPSIRFEHLQIARLGQKLAVFVVKDGQSAVLYDETRKFPSDKLLASLVLLGSP